MPDPDHTARIRHGKGPATVRGIPTVSRSLQYLAVIVLAVIVGVAAQQLLDVRHALIEETERQMARLDMVFAEQTGRAVETVDLLLRNTIETVQSLRGSGGNAAALGELLRRRAEGVRQLTELAVTDAAGVVIASSAKAPGAAESDEVRALLARFAAAPDRRLQISEPFREPDGSWSALMVRAIPAPGDSWDGLVLAHLNLRYFEDFYRAVELSENGAILLHRRDGTVLARYPHDESAIGKSYAELPPFRDILAHAMAGTVVMRSPLDGRERVLAIRALKAFPLAVNVSVDESMILAPWRRQAAVLGVVALTASTVIAALLLLLAQRSRQVEELAGEFRAARDAAELSNQRLVVQMQERERAEAALQQAQRIEAVGQLTGGVAHDFNNLLTVVLGNTDLLNASGQLDAEAQAWVATIESAAERGAALTGQLLAFSRRQPLVPAPVDIAAMLFGMSGLIHSALGDRIRLFTRFEPGLWSAMVDRTQIELVVLNLVINARDAMPDGGTLTVTAVNASVGAPILPEQPPAGEYVRITLADSGTGMTPEVRARAFEPFFTTKGPGKGSGLGLSQVYGVARQSGGGVQIESAPGVGTSVSVFLPRAAAIPARSAPVPPAAVARDGGVAILLVDDDAAVRATTGELLLLYGYRIVDADSGAAALALLETGVTVDVVVTDVAMPGMTGPELARELRARWPRLPVVFISGHADPEAVSGPDGLRHFVRKPFRPSDLAAQIELALREVAGAGAA